MKNIGTECLWKLYSLILLGSIGMGITSINPCFAQTNIDIVPDNTLGNEASQINNNLNNPNGVPSTLIEGGAERGQNLFHSLQEFNVNEGRGAYFVVPNDAIQNILTRVTGNNPSSINGILGTILNRNFDPTNANLFLINPNGIIFGRNGTLDVNGSFVGTTANAISFGEQGFFSATNPQTSSLLTVDPNGLLFNQINQNAAIQNNSFAPTGIRNPADSRNVFGLRVPDGKSLLLVGGNVSMNLGELNAYGGRVELGGLAEAGTVALDINGDNFKLGFPENVTRGDVSLTNRAFVYVEADGGGDIAVNARNIEITGGSLLSAGISQGLGTPDAVAGDIALNAIEKITIANPGSEVYNNVNTGAIGNSGNINIIGKSVEIDNNAAIKVDGDRAGDIRIEGNEVNLSGASSIELTTGSQDSGEISIRADKLEIAGNSRILSNTISTGKSGDITIDVGSFIAQENSLVAATSFLASGKTGNINLEAKDSINIFNSSQVSTFAIGRGDGTTTGSGGSISIETKDLNLQNGNILVSTFLGQGNAGELQIKATNSVNLSDGLITTSSLGAGGSGSILIETKDLNVENGGSIFTNVFDPSNVDVDTIDFQVSSPEAINLLSQLISTINPENVGKANSGNLTIIAENSVKITGQSANGNNRNSLSTATFGKGNGGNITIDSGSLLLQDGAQLRASTFGTGNAGNVTVTAKDAVSLTDANIFSTVGTGAEGKGGNIEINAGTFNLTEGASLTASTFGIGDAGNVRVTAKDAVSLTVGDIFSRVGTGAEGNGGNITIDSGSFNLGEGASLTASTFGQGDAGNVTVNAIDAVSLVGGDIFSSVERGGVGKGGNIEINAGSLSLRDGAQLATITREASDTQNAGKGNAGNINVNVTGVVDIAGKRDTFPSGLRSLVGTGAEGNGGNITIDSGSFNLGEGASLSASTFGQGNAGNVTVTAKDAVSLTDGDVFSTVGSGGVGNGGNINIKASSLSLRDGAQLLTSTRSASDTQDAGRGNAGNVNINVTGDVDIAGVKNGLSSAIFSRVGTGTQGKGGNITVRAATFKLAEGAILDARTGNNDRGGDITVNANLFEALNGGQLTATTSSNGDAGKITVNATDKVIINGNDPNFNDRVTNFPNRIGNIGANSGFFVNSTGSGNTGNIEINSPEITLDNLGKLNAESTSGNGGDIILNADRLLLLRRGSQITTNAGTQEQGGNGGNINIDSKFIVAIPKENSDITANAFSGTGGSVDIISQGVFGIEARDRQTSQSDITASSQLGVQGVTNINAPDNSNIQNSLIELAQNTIDSEALIATSCVVRSKEINGTFYIIGSQGFPYRPGDAVPSKYSAIEVQPVPNNTSAVLPRRRWKMGDPIVEPTGVYRLANGRRILSRECGR